MTYRLPAALLSLALLAGCGEEPVAPPADNDGRAAAGEVIGGTISDAMLPLDTVRSQAPPVVERSEAGAAGGPNGAPAASGNAEPSTPSANAAEAEASAEADEDDS